MATLNRGAAVGEHRAYAAAGRDVQALVKPRPKRCGDVTHASGASVVVRRGESHQRFLAPRLAERWQVGLSRRNAGVTFVPPCLARRPLRSSISSLAIFVSDHAVVHGMRLIDEQWHERPRGLTWIAVGAATAAALARYAINAVVPELESSEGILEVPQTAGVAGRRVLIVAGRGGRTELAAAFTRRGATVDVLELYSREAVTGNSTMFGDGRRRLLAMEVARSPVMKARAAFQRSSHAPSAGCDVMRDLRKVSKPPASAATDSMRSNSDGSGKTRW